MDSVLRSKFLRLLYEKAGGSVLELIDMYTLGDQLGLDKDQTYEIAAYLTEQKKIIIRPGNGVRMEDAGAKWVEEYNNSLA